MISKNVDFYSEKDLFVNYSPDSCSSFANQLAVSKVSGQANINYGEFCDGLYLKTFETGAIKMKQGDNKDSFLSFDNPEKNLVEFSFKKDQILVLTCSLAFRGSITKEGSQVAPEIVNSLIGVSDCFFQEKNEKDIIDGYFTDNRGFRKIADDAEEFQGISKEKSSIEILSTENPPTEEESCLPCPVYSYDIDIPIYGNGVQYHNGPISLTLVGAFLEVSEFAGNVIVCPGQGGGAGGGPDFCPCEFNEDDRNLKWTTYIKVEEYRVVN